MSARRLVPVVLALAAVVVVVVMSVRAWVVYPGTTGMGQVFPTLALGDGVRWTDVAAAHDGAADGSMTEELRRLGGVAAIDAAGPVTLYARFAPPSGLSVDTTSIGWPRPWYERSTHTHYEDAAARVGPVPTAWASMRSSWWDDSLSMYMADADAPRTESIVRRRGNLSNAALTIAIVGMAYWLVLLAARLSGRRLGRRGRLIAAGVLAAGVGVAMAATMRTTTSTTLMATDGLELAWSPIGGPGVSLGLSLDQLRQGDPVVMDEVIAGAVLAAIDEPPAQDVLAVQFVSASSEAATSFASAGWPLRFVWSTTPSGGTGAAMAHGYLFIHAMDRSVNFNIAQLAVIGIGVWLVWAVSDGLLRLWLGLRSRGRVRRGLCVVCTYPKPRQQPA